MELMGFFNMGDDMVVSSGWEKFNLIMWGYMGGGGMGYMGGNVGGYGEMVGV